MLHTLVLTRLSSLYLNHYQVLSVRLTKKFTWAFLLNVTEKPKQTFWPTQYFSFIIPVILSLTLENWEIFLTLVKRENYRIKIYYCVIDSMKDDNR